MKQKFGVAGTSALSEIIPVEPDLGNAGVGRIKDDFLNPFFLTSGGKGFLF